MVLQVISNDAPVDQELIVDAEFVQEVQEVAVVVEEGAVVEALQAPRPMHPTRRELREAAQA
jgi:flagellar biosynthesis regulator FlbT